MTKPTDAVSWFQPAAERSLALIRRVAPSLDTPIIDVGGGASVLIDDLVRLGYRELTVLDLAGSALDSARARLGPAAGGSRRRWLEQAYTERDFHMMFVGVDPVWQDLHSADRFHELVRRTRLPWVMAQR